MIGYVDIFFFLLSVAPPLSALLVVIEYIEFFFLFSGTSSSFESSERLQKITEDHVSISLMRIIYYIGRLQP